MENDPQVLFARRMLGASPYAELLLNRPAKGNAITFEMLTGLESAVTELEADREVRAVVIRGAGRFFCTGGDIREWSVLTPEQMRTDWIKRGIAVFGRIARLPQPVIALIQGDAMGGGLELALHADLRLALATASFATPEVTIGMVAGWSGVSRLAETIGVARARHLTLLGSKLSAAEALQFGLVTAVEETPETLELKLQEWLARLLANSSTAMALTKGLLAGSHGDHQASHGEAAATALVSEDCREGVRAFVEKRKPVFPAERRADLP